MVDGRATTLHHKVLCGYQGWFRCPGDGTGEGWLHWSRNRNRITPEAIPKPQNSIVLGGGKAESDGLAVSSPNLIAKGEQPAIAFVWREIPGEDRQLAYVLVVRYPSSPHLSSFELKADSGTDGRTGHSNGELQVGDKKIALSYKISVSPADETLEINDANQNLADGRVFLIDLATDPINVIQKEASLPTEVPKADSTAEVESLAEEILDHLVERSAEVAEFVRGE